jgi:hypothetical protein
LRLALNCVARQDTEALRAEFQQLIDLSFDLTLTGFKAVEIDTMAIDMPSAGVVQGELEENIAPRAQAHKVR